MRRNEYDPGAPYDPPPRRRRRQLGDEYDDAWAGGNQNDSFDDAAGYTWEDPRDGARHDEDSGPVVPLRRRYHRYRTVHPDQNSPTYYRDRAHAGEYGEYTEKAKRGWPAPDDSSRTGWQIPFWQILILVILGLAAMLATVLACVAILSL
jgi:hypothetical protein